MALSGSLPHVAAAPPLKPRAQPNPTAAAWDNEEIHELVTVRGLIHGGEAQMSVITT